MHHAGVGSPPAAPVRLLPAPERERYEALDGNQPVFVTGEHPDGVHVALMAVASPHNRAAVWNRRTGRIVWAPADTDAVCWLPGGEQVVLVRGPGAVPLDTGSAPPTAAAAAPVSRWAPAIAFQLERRSWPDLRLLGACPVRSKDANWSGRVVASPRGDLVTVVWLEQHVGGFELVRVAPDRNELDRQLEDAGYAFEPNCISGPAFSLDGRYLAMGCGRFSWWNAGDEYGDADPKIPSPGGRFPVGHVLVRDLDLGTQRELPVEVDLPIGWLPPEDHDGETSVDEPIGEPTFVSDTEFTVRLLTGATLQLSAQSS